MPPFPTWIAVLYFIVKGDKTFLLNTGLEGALVLELQINMQPVLLKSMGAVQQLWQDQHQGRVTTGLRHRDGSLSQHSKKSLLQPCWGRKGRGSDDPSGIWLLTPIWTVWAPIKRRSCLRGTCSPGARWWWNALKLFGKFFSYKVSFAHLAESVADRGSATGKPCWMLSGCICRHRQTLIHPASEQTPESPHWKVTVRCWPWFGHFSLHLAHIFAGVSC